MQVSAFSAGKSRLINTNKNALVRGLVSSPLVLSVRHKFTAGCRQCYIHL